jgi:hypothetical protein
VSGFDPAWLDLREPVDMAARDPRLLREAAEYANREKAPLIVDLGCGTASTVRAMAPHLSPAARWRLVDSDAVLLGMARRRCGLVLAQTCLRDLSAPDPLPLGDVRLVTASALLDLVSEAWIERLAAELSEAGAALYAGLIYDGRTDWWPPHASDGQVLAAFNRHQRTDKGFGPALGPEAAACARRILDSSGFTVELAGSPWRLDGAAAALVVRLIDGVALAAGEEGSVASTKLDGWRRFRLDHAADGRCLVGHYDLLARPFQASAAGRKQSGSKAQSKMNSPPRS